MDSPMLGRRPLFVRAWPLVVRFCLLELVLVLVLVRLVVAAAVVVVVVLDIVELLLALHNLTRIESESWPISSGLLLLQW